MLDSLYTAMFRPAPEVRVSSQAAITIGLLALFILALNAAGAAQLGVAGVIGFTLLFQFAGLLGWYWLSASVNLLAQLIGGQGNGRTTLLAIAQGLWPLLLTGPAISATQWSNTFGALFSAAITLGTFVTLVIAIRDVHHFGWLQAILCLFTTLVLSGLALLGLILWPLMLILGT